MALQRRNEATVNHPVLSNVSPLDTVLPLSTSGPRPLLRQSLPFGTWFE